jgi:hypothetical protein
MYPWIRDLFADVLGHDAARITTDSRTARGVRPDVAIDAVQPPGLPLSAWIVVEAKDEPDAFATDEGSDRILAGKWRYVGPDTEWFVAIDPITCRIRAITDRVSPQNAVGDIVFRWKDTNEAECRHLMQRLAAAAVAERERLAAFRRGDATSFAQVLLTTPDSRRTFLASLTRASGLLVEGITSAFEATSVDRLSIDADVNEFRNTYKGIATLSLSPFRLRGNYVTVDNAAQHRSAVRSLRERARRTPAAFRLATDVFPAYLQRTGEDKRREAERLLVEETASLLLARAMMLRFFEDHRFFGDRRYVCNGGVAAFQAMHAYFEASYPALLKAAYEAGGRLYHAVFDAGPLDWVLESADPTLSAAIELALLHLAPFDFATIHEEVLSALYGSFFDAKQRKAMGEHYTPPSLARWIVRRVGAESDGRILDAACGLGTFIVEAYELRVGSLFRRGGMAPEDAIERATEICGNDLNPFSATVAQLQMLWHIMALGNVVRTVGFPELPIASGFDSLTAEDTLFTNLEGAEQTAWADLDRAHYRYVVGNPPYIRPERRGWEPTPEQEAFFAEIGVKGNVFNLFIFKAMQRWLDSEGTLGFVIPLAFLDGGQSAKLRRLFHPDSGRWRIREIVDMEAVDRIIFPHAKVVPIVIIADRIPATASDTIIFRTVGPECVLGDTNETGDPDLDLERAETWTLPYLSAWTADGRILTRLTPLRTTLLRHFDVFQSLRDVAAVRWDKYEGSRIVQRELAAGPYGDWQERRLITWGAAFRNQRGTIQNGYTVYKGENITPCQLDGDPVARNIDPSAISDASIWRFPDSLPPVAYAFRRIALNLIAAPVETRTTMVLNTASVWVPEDRVAMVPVDFLVCSTVYQWIFAVAQREGVIQDAFANVYPSTVERLPWSDVFVGQSDELIRIRLEYLSACDRVARGLEGLAETLAALDTETVAERIRRDPTLSLKWSDVATHTADDDSTTWTRVQLGADLFHFVDVSDAATAGEIARILAVDPNQPAAQRDILRLRLPKSGSVEKYETAINDFLNGRDKQDVAAAIDKLDQLVADAFSLTPDDIAFMRRDLTTDPLFKLLHPGHPFEQRTFRGLLENLARADRYTRI